MIVTLVLTDSISSRLRGLCSLTEETGAVLLVKEISDGSGDLRLLARELILVPDNAYLERNDRRMQITPNGYLSALARARETGCLPIWLHTHPGSLSSPLPSELDHVVDVQLASVFRLRGESRYYGTLIFATRGNQLAFTGHLDDEAGSIPIHRMFEVGPRFSLTHHFGLVEDSLPDLFDRNVLAFGSGVQRSLNGLRVGLVGCGGTGSAVAEQLVRLGVRNLVVIDNDTISESNVTRVYGSTLTDVGRPKVQMLKEHLTQIAPDSTIACVSGRVTEEKVAKTLVGRDIIFGCTDDNAGRSILSKLSSFYLSPVIDCGVLISSRDGQITGINGRVSVLHPSAACLLCRGRIDENRARAEMLTPTERQRRIDEGYAPELGATEPAVVAFTSVVASFAVTELLERMTGFGPNEVPDEIGILIHERRLIRSISRSRPSCFCDPGRGKLGIGDTSPFLELTWTTG